MAYALTCACGYVRRLLVVFSAPSLLAHAQARAQGGAPPAKLGRRGDACGAVGDPVGLSAIHRLPRAPATADAAKSATKRPCTSLWGEVERAEHAR